MSQISPLLLDRSIHAFVPPREWSSIQTEFMTRHASIMQSVAGSGRTTLAIRLLAEANHDPIYMVDSHVNLAQLNDAISAGRTSSDDAISGVGLILAEPAAMSSLSGRDLRNLDHALIEAKTRLIIVTGTETRLDDEEALDYRLPPFEPPSHSAIVEKHLRWRFDKQANDLLSQEGLREAIDELLPPTLPCRRAGHLADIIHQITKDGTVDLAVLRRMMNRRDVDNFTIWMEGFNDLEDACFAVTLAVLDGLPYEVVSDASTVLAEGLEPAKNRRGTKVGRTASAARLEEFRARTRKVYSRGPYGRSVVQAVEYADRTYPRRVIEHFWQRSGRSKEMLAWLLDLAAGEEQSERVRIRAATALGLLSILNFDYLHHSMFERWAGDESYLRRDAVANALRVPAANPLTAANVLRLIETWHGLQRERRKQATAARSYGVSLAFSDPTWLIDRLGRLAGCGDLDVTAAVSRSLSDLAGRDSCELSGSVLTSLCEWLPNYRREFAAQMAFLQAATSLLTEVPDVHPDLTPELWPTLLVLADRDQEIRSELCLMWASVLHSGNSLDAATTLTDWAVMAERTPAMRQVLTYLLVGVSSYSPRVREIVHHIVDNWGQADHLQPLTATAAALKRQFEQLDLNTTSSEFSL
ncbi:hypothetical protein [Micromonospora sp. M61]|uniref:hypothetical protein n=1 Tax=Micromonospora sp. M61 TaxID=2824890 RepID=UPI001B398B81|nr:hypothetical protein [Micromonospora sp. M61]MBQ0980730.1 hypothetical protein [Micromonospora sp. M61]